MISTSTKQSYLKLVPLEAELENCIAIGILKAATSDEVILWAHSYNDRLVLTVVDFQRSKLKDYQRFEATTDAMKAWNLEVLAIMKERFSNVLQEMKI